MSCDPVSVILTDEQAAELRAVVNSRDVPAVVAIRARIVLWTAEGRMRKDVGALARVSLPTVDRWVDRYERFGLAGLEEHKRGGGREQVPAAVRARILALVRTTPPVETGLSDWSSREMARHVSRTEGWRCPGTTWRRCGGTTTCNRTSRARTELPTGGPLGGVNRTGRSWTGCVR